jgi:putative ABC transport system substrate-binding protein
MARAAQRDRARRDASGGPSGSLIQGSGTSLFAAIQTVAPSLRVEVSPVNLRDVGEVEGRRRGLSALPEWRLIVPSGGGAATLRRDLIVTLAARHKVAAVYYERYFVAAGGLVSYGSNFIDPYRQAAGYVDRILKGEKAADLPVQAPTRYETVLNSRP